MKTYREFLEEAKSHTMKASEHKDFVENKHPHRELLSHLRGHVDSSNHEQKASGSKYKNSHVDHKLKDGGKTHVTSHRIMPAEGEHSQAAATHRMHDVIHHAEKAGFKKQNVHDFSPAGTESHHYKHKDGSTLHVFRGTHGGNSHRGLLSVEVHHPLKTTKK